MFRLSLVVTMTFLIGCVSSIKDKEVMSEEQAVVTSEKKLNEVYKRRDGYLIYLRPMKDVRAISASSITQVVNPKTNKIKYPFFDFLETTEFSAFNTKTLIARRAEVELLAYDLGIKYNKIRRITAQTADRFLIEVEQTPILDNENQTYDDKKEFVVQKYFLAVTDEKPTLTPLEVTKKE